MTTNCLKGALAALVAFTAVLVYLLDDMDAGVRRFWPRPVYQISDVPDLSGRVALVTGANAGIGLSTARILAQKNCKVILGCRSLASCTKAAEHIREQGGKDVIPFELDLADSRSIFNFVQSFLRMNLPLHISILNAGVMGLPAYQTTKDGLEMQTGVNWVGHFYLQQLLQKKIEESAPSRVIIVSAKLHEEIRSAPESVEAVVRDCGESRSKYGLMHNYHLSKLLNIVHAKHLAERMSVDEKNVTVISLHPGVIKTELARSILDFVGDNFGRFVAIALHDFVMESLLMTCDEGAFTQLFAATSPEVHTRGLHGMYLRPYNRLAILSSVAQNKTFQKQAWSEGMKLIESFPRKE